MIDQLKFEPPWPKEGTVREAVLKILKYHHPRGVCRREFAHDNDVYEVANRIGELQRMGWRINSRLCERHLHTSRIFEYYLEGTEGV